MSLNQIPIEDSRDVCCMVNVIATTPIGFFISMIIKFCSSNGPIFYTFVWAEWGMWLECASSNVQSNDTLDQRSTYKIVFAPWTMFILLLDTTTMVNIILTYVCGLCCSTHIVIILYEFWKDKWYTFFNQSLKFSFHFLLNI